MHSLTSMGTMSRVALNAALRIGIHSSSEKVVSRKWATTIGAVDSEGDISSRLLIDTKRRGTPWRLPKLEYMRCLASSSFRATRS